MKTLEEQISGKCKHFNGIMNERCKADVLYTDVRGDKKPYEFPCLDRSKTNCLKAIFPTPEEVTKQLNEINISTGKTIGVLIAIKKGNAPKGTVPCPCGGSVHYVKAQSNGHVHAKCDTCDLSLME